MSSSPACSTSSQWLFSDDELAHPPSCTVVQDAGERFLLSRERYARAMAVRRVWELKDALLVPYLTVATACVFMHRFYMRKTVQEFSPTTTATAAFFLACKVEESTRSLKHIVNASLEHDAGRDARIIYQQPTRPHVDESAKIFQRLKHKVLKTEEAMLRVLCFDLTVRHAFPIVVKTCDKVWRDDAAKRTDVARVAWQFVTDSLASVTVLRFRPDVIAAAAVVAACVQLGVDLPPGPDWLLSEADRRALLDLRREEGEEPEPEVYWLEELGVEPDEIRDAVARILDDYRFAKDEFVVQEAAKLKPRALAACRKLVSPSSKHSLLSGRDNLAEVLKADSAERDGLRANVAEVTQASDVAPDVVTGVASDAVESFGPTSGAKPPSQAVPAPAQPSDSAIGESIVSQAVATNDTPMQVDS